MKKYFVIQQKHLEGNLIIKNQENEHLSFNGNCCCRTIINNHNGIIDIFGLNLGSDKQSNPLN